MERIAMPILDESIAPCFEVARLFMISEIGNGRETLTKVENCAGCEGFGRVRFLQENHVDVLICNGIKSFYRDLLIASGIKVISDVNLPSNEALNRYASKNLQATKNTPACATFHGNIPHEDLVCWAKDLFGSHGYKVTALDSHASSLVDFIAEMKCPLCSKSVRVAVCCGAHSYNYSQELKHFHYSTSSNYHARVYVYSATEELSQSCREYDIELIDPESEDILPGNEAGNRFPILRNPIEGHEKAFGGARSTGKE